MAFTRIGVGGPGKSRGAIADKGTTVDIDFTLSLSSDESVTAALASNESMTSSLAEDETITVTLAPD